MSSSESKTPIKNSVIAVFGIIFLIGGIALLGYSAYTLFNKSNAQEISEILPTKDLKLVFLKNEQEGQKSTEMKFLEKVFPNLVPKSGVIAVYSDINNKTQAVRIEEKEGETPAPKGLYCEESTGYWFCADTKNKSRIIQIVGQIQEKSPALIGKKEFQIAQQNFKNEEIHFFGKTSFLSAIIWENSHQLVDSKLKEGVFHLLDFFAEKSQYSWGTLSKGEFTLFTQKEGKYFSHLISKYDISEYFLDPSTDRYFLMKKPKIAWDAIFSAFDAQHISTEFLSKKALEKSFSTFFVGVSQHGQVSLNFKDDILPLFEGDVLWAENPEGSAIIYSLPKKSISEEIFQKFAHATEKIAQWSVPVKVGHALKDGTMVYEVFPNTENISLDNAKSENGEKMIFTNTEKPVVLGTVIQDTFLMVSNNQKFLDHFWALTGGETAFEFPTAKNTFFSFGFRKRAEENTPLTFAHISGREESETFVVSGKIDWNPDFQTEDELLKAQAEQEAINATPQNPEISEKTETKTEEISE